MFRQKFREKLELLEDYPAEFLNEICESNIYRKEIG